MNVGVDLLEFRPSEVAAAVAICAMRETKTVNTERAISLLSQHVKEVKKLNAPSQVVVFYGIGLYLVWTHN